MVFGLATHSFLDDGRVAAVVTRDGEQSLELLDPDGTRGRATGFRRADSRRRAVAAELAFYGEMFRFEPAADLPAVDLSTDG